MSDASQCSESQAFWSDGRSTTPLPQGTFPPIIEQPSNTAATAGCRGTHQLQHGLPGLGPEVDERQGWQPIYAQTDFHNYVTVCNASMSDLGITAAGTYNVILRVRTNAGTAGYNRFAIRGALVSDTNNSSPDGSKVSVYADGKLPIYMNATGSQTLFYIARLMPNNASHTLELSFFDVGDAGPYRHHPDPAADRRHVEWRQRPVDLQRLLSSAGSAHRPPRTRTTRPPPVPSAVSTARPTTSTASSSSSARPHTLGVQLRLH